MTSQFYNLYGNSKDQKSQDHLETNKVEGLILSNISIYYIVTVTKTVSGIGEAKQCPLKQTRKSKTSTHALTLPNL